MSNKVTGKDVSEMVALRALGYSAVESEEVIDWSARTIRNYLQEVEERAKQDHSDPDYPSLCAWEREFGHQLHVVLHRTELGRRYVRSGIIDPEKLEEVRRMGEANEIIGKYRADE